MHTTRKHPLAMSLRRLAALVLYVAGYVSLSLLGGWILYGFFDPR